MNPFTFKTSKTIINEIGSVARMGEICAELGIKRPLIVSDRGIVSTGLLNKLSSAIANTDSEHYLDVIADPPENVVEDATALAIKHGADAVIGYGGGSSMDTAKLVALLASSREKLADIYGVEQVRGKRLPLILVPTTAGTGSEVTPVAIVTTGATTKMGIVSSQLYPDVALLDAELTIGLPPGTTAATGVDAMVHAIEAYTSAHKKNPYSDMLAREALRLMSQNILTATHEGSNIEARQAMLYGACLAGQAFANAPVAAVHALAYPLGGHFHITHGLSNSLVLPHVLNFNQVAAHTLYAELADIVLPNELRAEDSDTKSRLLVSYLQSLISDLGLPHQLRDLGIGESDLPMLAGDAILQQRLLVNNPREVSESDALGIYQSAY